MKIKLEERTFEDRFPFYSQEKKSYRLISIFAVSNTKNSFAVFVKVLVEHYDDKEYQHLTDLMFQDVNTVQNIYFDFTTKPKTLRKIMAVSRCDLVKRLLSVNLSHGYDFGKHSHKVRKRPAHANFANNNFHES